MNLTLDEYNRLKSEVDELQRQEAELTGALDQIRKGLKEDFGIDDVDALEDLLTKYRDELEDASQAYRITRKRYDKKRRNGDGQANVD